MTQSPRPMTAPTLALELRETIARWFSARDIPMQSSRVILFALADLAAEQITANPTRPTQMEVLDRFVRDVVHCCHAANRSRMGGVPAIIVKQ